MRTLLVVAAMLAAPGLAAQRAGDSPSPRASLFVARGCRECHAIEALQVKARTDVGPDLTFAYAEVPYRYGMTMERFFDQPPGVMRMVLAGHVQLERRDRESLVQLFRELYSEHLARLDSLCRTPRPVRAGQGSSEQER